jgi:hypothetical protein
MPVVFLSESILQNCGGSLGYPDSALFVMTDDEAFELLENCKYDLASTCKSLDVPLSAWTGQRVFAVQIPSASAKNLRISSGNELCVDAKWLPGGLHASGFKQAVIDPVPLEECQVMEVKWKS